MKEYTQEQIQKIIDAVEKTNEKVRMTNQQLSFMKNRNQKLNVLLEATKIIMSEVDLTKLLRKLMEKIVEVMEADRSTLFLVDWDRKEIWSKVHQGDEINEIRFPLGKGISSYVIDTGETLNIDDVYNDPRFNPDIDKKTGYTTRNMLCMPIKNNKGETIGVTQVLNKLNNLRFEQSDIAMLEAFSALMAISLENALQFEKLSHTMKAFELFVPKNYLEKIAKHGVDHIKLGQSESTTVTVLFLDIRDFTQLSQSMTPEEIIDFLNDYFKQMNSIITKNNGFIDKYVGDGFMSIFMTSDGTDAVNTAIAIKKHLGVYNRHRVDSNKPPFNIGIGVSTGQVVVGTVGSHDRMDSTCIGNTVVIAKRIESLTKIYRVPILISSSTLKSLKDADKFLTREVDSVRVKGRKEPEVIFEVYNLDEGDLIEKKKNSYPELMSGMSYYKAREWDQAISSFTKSLEIFPNDNVAQNYIKRCFYFKSNPPDESWDGSMDIEITY